MEIPEGWWGSKAQEIPERRVVVGKMTFPDAEIPTVISRMEVTKT